MKDTNGREYAKLANLNQGMFVEVDDGFELIPSTSCAETER